MNREEFAKYLASIGACHDSLKFVASSKHETAKEIWDNCERGDWLLWLAAKAAIKRETVVFAACQCARLALKYTKDQRVLACIEITEKWCRGEATLGQVREARYAVYAVYAYAAYSAAAAAAAAADADAAAADAAYAAYAYAAAYAAYAAADADACLSSLNKCAEIVRKHIKFEEVIK